MTGRERLIQVYGIREIAAGAALLTAADKRPWVLARLAGDGLDMATLAPGVVRRDGRNRGRAAFALAATATVTPPTSPVPESLRAGTGRKGCGTTATAAASRRRRNACGER